MNAGAGAFPRSPSCEYQGCGLAPALLGRRRTGDPGVRLHRPLAVGPQRPAAAPARRSRRPPADVHPQRCVLLVVDAEHLHVAESHQQLTDARGVALRRDPPDCRLPVSADSGGSLAFSRGPSCSSLHPHTRRARLCAGPNGAGMLAGLRVVLGLWDSDGSAVRRGVIPRNV